MAHDNSGWDERRTQQIIRASQREEASQQPPYDTAISRLGSRRPRRPLVLPSWRIPYSVLFTEAQPGQMTPLIATAPLEVKTEVASSEEDVLTRFTGQPEGIRFYAEPPDVLVMDHDLHDLSASEWEHEKQPFLARLHEAHVTQQALVVIVTPTITVAQKIRAFQLGASHVLVEPVAPDSFWLTLRLLLRFRELASHAARHAIITERRGD